MRMYDLIEKKRLGGELTDDEIRFLTDGFTKGTIPDYQMSAFLMATVLRGMSHEETVSLTRAMLDSGERIDLSRFGTRSADKHSTGGVGDKTTLAVLPIAASAGVICAKMSGRGLGHTGGTVDKLESVRGYNSSLSPDEFLSQAERIGIALVGQSGNLVPADKKIYALRDVTATVDSIPLIASSIMSKKLASGAHSIVLDVKYGSGAFMKDPESAKKLASEMVSIGKSEGRRVSAFITDMDTPLGRTVGNSIEVLEGISVLRGEGPDDLRSLVIALSGEMISLALGMSREEGRKKAEEMISSRKAYGKFCEWMRAQGADYDGDHPERSFASPAYSFEVKAKRSGYIASMNCENIGKCACMLGAGRTSKDSAIDLSAGLRLLRKTGEYAEIGDTVAVMYSSDPKLFPAAEELFTDSLCFSENEVAHRALIYDVSER